MVTIASAIGVTKRPIRRRRRRMTSSPLPSEPDRKELMAATGMIPAVWAVLYISFRLSTIGLSDNQSSAALAIGRRIRHVSVGLEEHHERTGTDDPAVHRAALAPRQHHPRGRHGLGPAALDLSVGAVRRRGQR